jgi:Spy/CpxP family protein refolding chaperone
VTNEEASAGLEMLERIEERTMRSMLKTGMVAAIAAVFVASVAIASGQDSGQRRGPGLQGPGGPGGRGMMPGIMRELTEEQRKQVRTILESGRDGQQGPPADAKLRRELEAELLADAPSDQKIEELKTQILAAQAEGLSKHIAIQKQIAQVLTAEQRAKARERLAQAPAAGRGRGFRF